MYLNNMSLKPRKSGLFAAHIAQLVVRHFEGTLNDFIILCPNDESNYAERYKNALKEKGVDVEYEAVYSTDKSRGHHSDYNPEPVFQGYSFKVVKH